MEGISLQRMEEIIWAKTRSQKGLVKEMFMDIRTGGLPYNLEAQPYTNHLIRTPNTIKAIKGTRRSTIKSGLVSLESLGPLHTTMMDMLLPQNVVKLMHKPMNTTKTPWFCLFQLFQGTDRTLVLKNNISMLQHDTVGVRSLVNPVPYTTQI